MSPRLLKFFDDADVSETWNNMALYESNIYRGATGTYHHAIAYEATDSSCWYVFEGRTEEVKRRFERVSKMGSHGEVDNNLNVAVRVKTRADAVAAVEAHNQRYESEGYTLFRTVAELRKFNNNPMQVA